MTIYEAPLTDAQEAELNPLFVPRPNPLPIPAPNIFDTPTMCIEVNEFWISHILGVLEVLDQPDAWIGTTEEVEGARQQVRELIVKLGAYCMDDPCCPDLVESSQIANVVQMQNVYNTWNTQNINQAQQNQGLYDGTPESLYHNAGANFDSDSSGVLCSAVDNFLGQMISQVAANTALAAAMIAGGTAAAAAALVALGVLTGGTSAVVGIAMGGMIAIALADVERDWNNPTAQNKVRCCMFENLEGQALTQENFSNALDGCDFDADSPEERIRSGLAPMLEKPENWLAMLQALNVASDGGTDRCDCECNIDDIDLMAFSPSTTVTRLTATTWRVQGTYQPNNDPARPNATAAFVGEILGRCVNFVSFSQGQSDSWTYTCGSTEPVYSVGGGGGEAYRVNWRQWDGDAIDTIITLACVEE